MVEWSSTEAQRAHERGRCGVQRQLESQLCCDDRWRRRGGRQATPCVCGNEQMSVKAGASPANAGGSGNVTESVPTLS